MTGMTSNKLQLARTLFRLKIYSSEGFEFERLFGQVLEQTRPGFQKIKPYGNQGDRGNDGYERADGRYFQVFAPANPAQSVYNAVKKAEEDFQSKLLPYWGGFCSPKEYFFVFNDKYKGSFFQVEKTLSELKSTHSLNECQVYLSKNLEQEFMILPEDLMAMIIGGIPEPESMSQLDYSVLGEVISHILDNHPADAATSKLINPDFDEKIKFNDLIHNGIWLTCKQREVWQVDEYLYRNSEFAKETIRDNLAGYYKESLAAITDSTDEMSAGDLRFAYILDRIAPKDIDPIKDRLRKDAALVLMSKYFETCDIFEEPRNAATS